MGIKRLLDTSRDGVTMAWRQTSRSERKSLIAANLVEEEKEDRSLASPELDVLYCCRFVVVYGSSFSRVRQPAFPISSALLRNPLNINFIMEIEDESVFHRVTDALDREAIGDADAFNSGRPYPAFNRFI